jgi:hypothetical protein
MRPNRAEMKLFPTWGALYYYRTSRQNLYVFSYGSLLFSGKRLSVMLVLHGQRN